MPLFDRPWWPKSLRPRTPTSDTNSSRTTSSSGSIYQSTPFRYNDSYAVISKLQRDADGGCSAQRSLTTGNVFVVKLAKGRRCDSPNSEQGGRRKPLPNEARILLSKLLPHPNIIHLYATEQDSSCIGRHLLYLEYCAGGDLLDQISHFRSMNTPTPVIFTLHVLVGLSKALAFLHYGLRQQFENHYITEKGQESVIHGDIKPDNIFLRWPGRRECGMPDIVLADFGMAQVAAESWGITGTPGYDAPEVAAVEVLRNTDPAGFKFARNARVVTTKTDMYQLGLVMHLLVTDLHFPTCWDPYDIEVPAEYREVTGFVAALVWLLQPAPEDRPECSGDLDEGFLFAVDVFQTQKEALYRKDGPLDLHVWNLDEAIATK